MKGRWPLLLLLGATALAVGVLFLLPGPNRTRPLPDPRQAAPREAPAAVSAPASLPVVTSAASEPVRSVATAPAVVGAPAASTDYTHMRRREILAIRATQFVYIGYTELNTSRRGTLMRRSNRERINVTEGDEVDGLSVRELTSDHCVLAEGDYTYTLYLIDLAYMARFQNTLPIMQQTAEEKAKAQRYYEEMFARPERARNSRVGQAPVAGPLTEEEAKAGEEAYVADNLGPKLDRLAAERASGANPHSDLALSPDERINYDPLQGPPPNPSQMRPLTPDEYRQAMHLYWQRYWPGRTPLPGVYDPPPPPADLSEYVRQRRNGGG